MIVDGLLIGIKAVLMTVFGVLPSLPAVPSEWSTPIDFVIDQMAAAVSLLVLVLSAPLLVSIGGLLVLLFNFERIYHFTMFIVRKIPAINVK